jgi:hypothetical protein
MKISSSIVRYAIILQQELSVLNRYARTLEEWLHIPTTKLSMFTGLERRVKYNPHSNKWRCPYNGFGAMIPVQINFSPKRAE